MVEIPSRSEVIARFKASGGAVAAVFPVHYPRSLFRAFGILPIEVWGPPGRDTTPAAAHLQAYACSVVKSGLSFLLSGGLDAADLLVVPHTCDSLQGIGSLLLDFHRPRKPVLTMYVPRGDGEAALRFYAAEIRATHDRLVAATGRRPTPAELTAAEEREARADYALATLLDARAELAEGDRELYRILRSREFLPAEDFTRLAEAVLATRAPRSLARTPIVLSGMLPEPMDIFDAIAEAGGRVAGDDLACTGRRRYTQGTRKDPFERMAERILMAPPCSTRGSSVAARADHLKGLAARSGARAVLFYEVKFCEPEAFYLPQLRAHLESAGLRTVTLEIDVSDALPHQAITRLEALLETVA